MTTRDKVWVFFWTIYTITFVALWIIDNRGLILYPVMVAVGILQIVIWFYIRKRKAGRNA